MDRAAPSPEGTPPRDPTPHSGPNPDACEARPTPRGPDLIAVTAFVQTIRHFFPDLNDWLDKLPDSRDQESVTYSTRFLAWIGLLLFTLQIGSRRKLDDVLDEHYTQALDNVNRLAGTRQQSLPVHDTLHYFMGHIACEGFIHLRWQMVQRLLRMKVMDDARLLGRVVVPIDGTGLFTFHTRHCAACLERKTKNGVTYQHHVLEAKLLGPAGLVVSIGTEFIENAGGGDLASEEFKQDCELKAFQRLAPKLKAEHPQLAMVLAGDGLFACGATLQITRDNQWSYVLTFKSGRLPSVWSEFQRLKPLCPENERTIQLEDGGAQTYRWVRDLSYQDDQKRTWTFHAMECTETSKSGERQYFAWITDLPVTAENVILIATKGGRPRWKIENEAFNRQKNHGPNLEHAYTKHPETWKAYYYLLQIAFILTQLVERGSLIPQLAAAQHRKPRELFSSLANIVLRLRECLRLLWWPDECFSTDDASRRRIRFPDSS
jgi:hypothetical protein